MCISESGCLVEKMGHIATCRWAMLLVSVHIRKSWGAWWKRWGTVPPAGDHRGHRLALIHVACLLGHCKSWKFVAARTRNVFTEAFALKGALRSLGTHCVSLSEARYHRRCILSTKEVCLANDQTWD